MHTYIHACMHSHLHMHTHTDTHPQFSSIPEHYDPIYTKLTRQGARVLALGYKELGNLSLREVRVLSYSCATVAYQTLPITLPSSGS